MKKCLNEIFNYIDFCCGIIYNFVCFYIYFVVNKYFYDIFIDMFINFIKLFI